MKDTLSWRLFLLAQPAVLVYAYLVGCFLGVVTETPPYRPGHSPFNYLWLIFVSPSALLLGLAATLIARKFLCAKRTLLLLFMLVPLASAGLVQIFFIVMMSLFKIEPAG